VSPEITVVILSNGTFNSSATMPVGGENRALAEIRLAGANQNRVIGMYLDPRLRRRSISRVAECPDAGLLHVVRFEQAKADQQRATSLNESAARKRCAEYVRRTVHHRLPIRDHELLLFDIAVEARCTA
jgi:hypothetical protein